jgi:hypothetical protein
MTGTVTLAIGEIGIEADPGAADPETVRRALEAALGAMAATLQARLAGRDGLPAEIGLADLVVRTPDAAAALREADFRRLADALMAAIAARIGAAA